MTVVTGAVQITAEEETTILLGLKAITDTLPKTHPRHLQAYTLYTAMQTGTWLYKTEPQTQAANNDS